MSRITPASLLRSRLLHCRGGRVDRQTGFDAGQAGEVSVLTLAIILIAPLVILGALSLVLVMAYMKRVSRVTAELESKKPTVCPACGHKLVEIRNFCAECGASIRPPEPEQPETGPEEEA